jgi:hypothetical protein
MTKLEEALQKIGELQLLVDQLRLKVLAMETQQVHVHYNSPPMFPASWVSPQNDPPVRIVDLKPPTYLCHDGPAPLGRLA